VVIIFFMYSAELEEYHATSYNGALSRLTLLKEKQSHSETEQTIERAVTSGQATLTVAAQTSSASITRSERWRCL